MLLDAALEYASYGWKVVRLHYVKPDGSCSCSRGADCPQKSRGKHPMGKEWQNLATDDEETIAEWWAATPDANIGILLGPKSGIIDIEFDDEAGREFADRVLKECYTPTYKSGRSVHRLFRYTDQLPAVTVPHINGLEFRLGQTTKGAQSVAPPSLHWTGVRYQWLPGLSPQEVEVAEIPEHVLLMLQNPELNTEVATERAKSTRNKLYEQPLILETVDGRDETLYKESCALWREKATAYGAKVFADPETQAKVYETIWAWNQAKCRPPLDDGTLQVKVDGARRFIEGQVKSEAATKGVSLTGMGLEHREKEWWPGQWELTVVHSEPARYLLTVPAWSSFCQEIVIPIEDYSDATKVAKIVLAATKCVVLDDQPGRWPSIWNGRKATKTQPGERGLKAKLMDVARHAESLPDEKRGVVVAEILWEAIQKAQRGAVEPDARAKPVFLEDGTCWLRWRQFWDQYTRFGEVTAPEVASLARELSISKQKNSKVWGKEENRVRYVVLSQGNVDKLRRILSVDESDERTQSHYIGAKKI